MLAIMNSLNAYNLPILQPILMILVSKFMVCRALSDKTYLFLGLLCTNRNKHRLIFSSAEILKKPIWQTVWTQIGAVCSGSTLFASILNSSVMSGNYLQQTISADDIF